MNWPHVQDGLPPSGWALVRRLPKVLAQLETSVRVSK